MISQGDNSITNECIKALAESLKFNKSIKFINLGNIWLSIIEKNKIEKEAVKIIAEMLIVNKTIHSIYLSNIIHYY